MKEECGKASSDNVTQCDECWVRAGRHMVHACMSRASLCISSDSTFYWPQQSNNDRFVDVVSIHSEVECMMYAFIHLVMYYMFVYNR